MAETAVSRRIAAPPGGARVDAWLESHIEWLALLALAAGFIVRVAVAQGRYLVADEALDYLLINQPSALEAYRASLMQAHPPLYYFLLYYWHFLGKSALMLRFPSVAAGTLVPWVAFLWLKRLGKTSAFLALLLLTFVPTLVAFSTEMRPYAFLLLFLTAALWMLDRGFAQNSAGSMLLFGLFLCLAIFTQYSAIWAAIAMGIYALVRIFGGELKKAAIVGWVASQACALVVLGLLWLTHISKLHNGAMESVAVSGWLRAEYFQPGENPFAFALRTTANAFFYLLTRRLEISLGLAPVGIVIALFFLFAIVILLARRMGRMRLPAGSSRPMGCLMLLPFVVGCAGALLRLYPYGGSRHVAYLAPFALGGIALGVAWLSGKAVWPGIAATVALLIVSTASADPTEYMPAADQASARMAQAVKYVRAAVPANGVVVVDYNTSLVMRYYLCSGRGNAIRNFEDRISQFPCGKYEMARTRGYDWSFTSENLGPLLSEMEKQFGWKPGERLWLVQAAETRLDAGTLGRFGGQESREFGEDISVTPLRAP